MKAGIGASVPRKEDERFLRGRGQYVGDFQMPAMRDVAFVRSPVAHARLRSVAIPEKHKDAVVTADDLTGINCPHRRGRGRVPWRGGGGPVCGA